MPDKRDHSHIEEVQEVWACKITRYSNTTLCYNSDAVCKLCMCATRTLDVCNAGICAGFQVHVHGLHEGVWLCTII